MAVGCTLPLRSSSSPFPNASRRARTCQGCSTSSSCATAAGSLARSNSSRVETMSESSRSADTRVEQRQDGGGGGACQARLQSGATVLYLIYNPVAGRGRAPAALAHATRLLDAAHADYVIHQTDGPGHATELAMAAPPGATIVAVGGDGTVHQVVKGLVVAGSPGHVLGVLPVGSGDDFAFALGLDRHDMAGAVARLLAHETARIDLPTVNGEPFVNALGVGFDAEVAHRLSSAPSFLKGLAAYLYA